MVVQRREIEKNNVNRANNPNNVVNANNAVNIINDTVTMDAEEYTRHGVADKIGREEVSRRKMSHYMGILVCLRKSCEYGAKCRNYHVPS